MIELFGAFIVARSFLITGGLGFIGSHLADVACRDGHSVTVLDNLSTGSLDNVGADVRVAIGDVADAACMSRLAEQVDGIFHLAAVSSVAAYAEDWARVSRTNLLGTVTVFEAAARAGIPVVYASSAAVYGDTPLLPIREDSIPAPISSYGAEKWCVEMHAATTGRILDLTAVGLRFFNVYGPRQTPGSPYSGVISVFLDRLASGQPVQVHGDGRQTRDFVFVEDVAQALLRAMACAGDGCEDVYNVCSGRETSVLELLDHLESLAGRTSRRTHSVPRPNDIRRSCGDPATAERDLGFRASVEPGEGLRQTFEWLVGTQRQAVRA